MQHGPLHWLIHAVAVMEIGLAWVLRANPAVSNLLLGLGLMIVLVGLAFKQLTVEDEGEEVGKRSPEIW